MKASQLLIVVFSLFSPFLLLAQESTAVDTATLNQKGRAFQAKKEEAKTLKEKIYFLEEAFNYYQKAENWEKVIRMKAELALQHIYAQEYDDFDDAIADLKILLSLHEVSEEAHSYANEMLAWHAEIKEDYITAERLYKEAFDYVVKGSNNMRIFSMTNNLGYFYFHYISDYERSVNFYQKALNFFKELEIKNNLRLGIVYSNLGVAFKASNYLDSAQIYLHRSLAVHQFEEGSNFILQTKWWNYQNLSDLYLNNAVYDSCLYYGQKALAILEKENYYQDDYQNYHTLGNYYLKADNYPKALSYFQQGLKRAKRQVDVFRPINAMVNLADVLSKHGDHQAALDSLQIGIQSLCPEFKGQDIFTNPMAEAFAHKKSALKLIEKRAAIFYRKYTKTKDPLLLSASLDNYQLATELIQLIRREYAGDISKYFLAEKVLSTYESAIAVAYELYEDTGDEKYMETAFYFMEQNKSALLTESIKENTAKGFGGLPDDLLTEERNLKLAIVATKKKIYETQKKTILDQSELKTLSDELFTLKRSYDDLIGTLEQEYPKYYELKHQTMIASIDQLQDNVLDDRTGLLEYFVGIDHIFLFCIEKSEARFFKIKRPEQFLASFNQLRNIISTPPKSESYDKDLEQFNKLSSLFYDLLLRESLADIKAKHLIIIPDDLLIYLPFEALLRENTQANGFSLKDQSYLLEDFEINYSSSATMLLNTKDLFYTAQKDFVGFAPSFKNPLLQASRNCNDNDLYSLQCSEQEVATINGLFAGASFLQTEAKKENFESNVQGYNIIHLATHACVDEVNPDFSRIYFTDDFLSNYDLTNMRIETNLAVLSACNTNVGPLMKGDGVSSISKGFLLAGCPSVLTSLWSVDDCSTSELMIDFYQSLKTGKTKSQSLRDAKLNYLRKADNVNAHPYYWAPFLLSGQDQAIIKSSNKNIWWWLIGGVLVLLMYLFFRKKNTV